jgi:hypothetical protein
VVELHTVVAEKAAHSESLRLVLERTELEVADLNNTCLQKDMEIAQLKRHLSKRIEKDRIDERVSPFHQGVGAFT